MESELNFKIREALLGKDYMEEKLLKRLDELPPEELIFGGLLVLSNKIQVVVDKSMTEITLKQWLLIIMIMQFQDTPPTLTEVASAMGSSRQNVKQLALKLEQKGFLKIEKDADDSRILRLIVLPTCMTLFETQVNYQRHVLELLYKGIKEEDKKIMAKGIRQLLINVSDIEELLKEGYKI